MSDPKKESPYANIDMDEYTKRMKENRDKYGKKESKILKFVKWYINIGASFMGLDKKNILADADPTAPQQNPYSKDHSAGAAFRASHRAEPRKPTHEEMLIREMEFEAIKSRTDGKGDDDCKCK